MRAPRTLEVFFHQVRGVTPKPVRTILRALGFKRVTQWLNPIENPAYVWVIADGKLKGMRMRIGAAENYHIIAQPYEPAVCEAIARIVKPGFVCADVGAHIGYMTLFLAKLVGPTGRVVGFDPHPENADVITQNVVLNGFAGWVVVENLAVSNGQKSAVAFCRGPTSSQGTTRTCGWEKTFDVQAVSLDAYFGANGHLDFAKIDVEGAEVDVVEGMLLLLRSARPVLLLEVHGKAGWPAIEALKEENYQIYDLSGIEQSDSILQDHIVHLVARPN